MESQMESEEMEMSWFFQLQFHQAYDSAYDCHSLFSLGHKHSYDSDSNSNSFTSENQPLVETYNKFYPLCIACLQ